MAILAAQSLEKRGKRQDVLGNGGLGSLFNNQFNGQGVEVGQLCQEASLLRALLLDGFPE